MRYENFMTLKQCISVILNKIIYQTNSTKSIGHIHHMNICNESFGCLWVIRHKLNECYRPVLRNKEKFCFSIFFQVLNQFKLSSSYLVIVNLFYYTDMSVLPKNRQLAFSIRNYIRDTRYLHTSLMKISLTSFLCFCFVFRPFFYFRNTHIYKIGRASCRERVQISVVAVSLKKKI